MQSQRSRFPVSQLLKLEREFPPPEDGSVYLNSGSCGRKPTSVLATWSEGVVAMNVNPTLSTFLDTQPLDRARRAASQLFAVPEQSLLLTSSTSQGLQLIMQSLLAAAGDELVTTDHEHGITKTICRYLEEKRGVVVRRLKIDPFAGSTALCQGLLDLVTARTRLVQVSEIDCFTGWRPDLALLAVELDRQGVPLLVDGAHSPGQGPCRPARYPLWVGSGHKWLGGPNGTGFVYARPDLVPLLEPLWLGDRFYNYARDQILRFEYQGTADVARWLGLAAALELNSSLGQENIERRQSELIEHLRRRLVDLPEHEIKTPAVEGETSGMLTVSWAPERVPVADLREELWQRHRVWVQPDFLHDKPGHGMRISCHVANSEKDIDRLIEALAEILA